RAADLAGPRRPQPVAADLDNSGPGGAPRDGDDAVAVTGHEGIEIDQVTHPVADVLQGPGDHEAPVGEPEQHDAVKILIQDGVDDVGDVGGQAHLRAGEVDALTDTGEARREDLVPGRPERTADLAEAVCAAPRPVHQNEDRHLSSPSAGRLPSTTLVTFPPGIVGTGSYDESLTRERLLAWRLANHHLAATRTG